MFSCLVNVLLVGFRSRCRVFPVSSPRRDLTPDPRTDTQQRTVYLLQTDLKAVCPLSSALSSPFKIYFPVIRGRLLGFLGPNDRNRVPAPKPIDLEIQIYWYFHCIFKLNVFQYQRLLINYFIWGPCNLYYPWSVQLLLTVYLLISSLF